MNPLPRFSFFALLVGCSSGASDSIPADRELPAGVEALSLLGDTLRVQTLPSDVATDREAKLAEALAAHERTPTNADSIIWLGRRLGYLMRYREAIALYSSGIALHSSDARLYRHRGHRYISLRQFDRAIADLKEAARLSSAMPDEVEPDGLPNARGVPTSTLQFNVWYHLGLAHYLKGDFEHALAAYRECLAVSTNPDARVATSHWLYMTLRRLGQERDAHAVLTPIRRDLDIIENDSYHRLLLFYRGDLSLDELLAKTESPLKNATVGYGIGNWHLYAGRVPEARAIFRRILAGSSWSAFGYIAAEAELARSGR